MRAKNYKRLCHELIDEIWGNDTGLAYQWLHRKFGGDIHFSTLHNEDLLHLIYNELLLIHSPKDKKYKTLKIPPQVHKRPIPSYKQMFTNKEVLREVGRRNAYKVLPWYKKILHKLFSERIKRGV